MKKIFVFTYDFHPSFKNWMYFYWNNYKQTTKYTYQIHFNENENYSERYTSKVKGPLKNAEKNKLQIADTNIETFCEVIENLQGKKNNPSIFKRNFDSFFEKIIKPQLLLL